MFIKKLELYPKIIFLIDGLGALLTAFFLFVILKTFNEYFGISQITLTYLSLISFVFFFYSIACFFLLGNHWKPFLKVISIANFLYCILTLGIVIYFYQSITLLGIIYFLVEIIVVCGLVFMELKTITACNTENEKSQNR